MAKVKITGHASGTGILTVTAPNTSTDRTITLPDATGTLAITTDDDDKLPLAGGTMTGTLTIEENMASDTQSTPETVASFGAKASSTGSDLAAGSGTRLELKIPSDDSPYTVTGTAIASIKEEGNETNSSSALAFYTSQNDTTLDEYMRITSDGRGLSQFTAKAWCNFTSSSTTAIQDSHNVSSVTDRGTGWTQINFANNMANANYAAAGMSGNYTRLTSDGDGLNVAHINTFSLTGGSATTTIDESRNFVIIFGD